jgi:hypothetical protein
MVWYRWYHQPREAWQGRRTARSRRLTGTDASAVRLDDFVLIGHMPVARGSRIFQSRLYRIVPMSGYQNESSAMQCCHCIVVSSSGKDLPQSHRWKSSSIQGFGFDRLNRLSSICRSSPVAYVVASCALTCSFLARGRDDTTECSSEEANFNAPRRLASRVSRLAQHG